MAANIVGFIPQRPKRRVFRQSIYPLQQITDREVYERYRFSKNGIRYICDLVKEDCQRQTMRNHAIDVQDQVLLTLRYLASGNFLQVVGDSVGVDKSTVSRSITSVCRALVKKNEDFIKFPKTAQEKMTIRDGFYNIGGFPNVIGCVDGSHIRIQAPTEDEKCYVNRKCYHSINVMAVCDHEGKYLLNIIPHPVTQSPTSKAQIEGTIYTSWHHIYYWLYLHHMMS